MRFPETPPCCPAPGRRLRRAGVAAILVTLLVGLGACTSSSSDGGGGGGNAADAGETAMRKAPEVCSVLKPADAQKALGSVTQAPQSSTVDGVATCVWRPIGAQDPNLALTVSVDTQKTVKAAAKAFDSQKPSGATAISGVQGAYVEGSPPKAHLRVGNLIVTISLGNMADPNVATRLDAAATAVAANL